MSDDNTIQFPVPGGRPYMTADCDQDNPLPVMSVADVASPEFSQLDLNALFNLREWVSEALKAKGAKIIGAGIGCGGTMGIADVQIELDGHQCNIEIRPLADIGFEKGQG